MLQINKQNVNMIHLQDFVIVCKTQIKFSFLAHFISSHVMYNL